MKDVFHPQAKLTVEEQIRQIDAIHAYNKALPKRRKIKDSLPEPFTTNITATYKVKRTVNKKKEVVIAMETQFKQVGIVDGVSDDEFRTDPFSLAAKQRQL